MICPKCLQDVGDVTAHGCLGPPRGTAPRLGARIELRKLEAVAEARIREIVREELVNWAKALVIIDEEAP